MNDEQLVLVAIPPLVAILLNREREKGAPLTEDEVLALRNGATCMAMRPSMAAQMVEQRGYEDIRLETAWEDWNAVRPSLGL